MNPLSGSIGNFGGFTAALPTRGELIYSASTAQAAIRGRFNPLRMLTPESLATDLDAFDAGWLCGAARIFKAIVSRDSTLATVVPKREGAPARAAWQILKSETRNDAEAARAELHAAVLEHAYNSLRCTSALDSNQRGGVEMLRRQMMGAVTYRYAVHHIVWKAGPVREVTVQNENGTETRYSFPTVEATFEHVPLEYFENSRGRLAFLPLATASQGAEGALLPHDSGEWMVTCGQGIGFAAAICYMFKRLALGDWMEFSQDFAQGKVLGRTTASQDSPAGQAFAELVAAFSGGSRAVIYGDDNTIPSPIETMQNASTAGADVFAKLVEKMERANVALYMGADLGTMSAGSGEGSGASLQGDATDTLLADDVQMICESLWEQFDRFVIRYTLGDDKPLAYFAIPLASDPDLSQIRESAGFLADRGVPISASNVAERLGFSVEAGDEPLLRAASPAMPGITAFNAAQPRQRQFIKAGVKSALAGLAADFAPLRKPLEALVTALESGDAERIRSAAASAQAAVAAESGGILRGKSEFAASLQTIIGPALLSGLSTKTK